MARVRLPTVLRRYAGGEAWVEAAGGTVRQVLADLGTRYPTLAHHLLDERGDVRRYVNVFVRDEEIRTLQYLDTAVGPADEVLIIPSVAGGQPRSGGTALR